VLELLVIFVGVIFVGVVSVVVSIDLCVGTALVGVLVTIVSADEDAVSAHVGDDDVGGDDDGFFSAVGSIDFDCCDNVDDTFSIIDETLLCVEFSISGSLMWRLESFRKYVDKCINNCFKFVNTTKTCINEHNTLVKV
jgi:hypothetical protein